MLEATPLAILEGSTVVEQGLARPELRLFVAHRSMPPERWKPTSAALIAAADRVVDPHRRGRLRRAASWTRSTRWARAASAWSRTPRGRCASGRPTSSAAFTAWPARPGGERGVLRTLSLAHSPDSDDAFMFYGLASGHVAADGLEIVHVLKDIETLNREAREGRHEITAISIHAYPHVADRYALMPCGGSIGDGYGPLLVAREPLDPAPPRRA